MRTSSSIPPPPRWADRLLEWFCYPEYLDEVQGDLHEYYYSKAKSGNIYINRVLYIYYVFKSFNDWNSRRTLFLANENYGSMLGKSLIIAFRNLKKRKFATFINLFGFSLGIASCLLLTVFFQYENSYDRFHQDFDRIYRIVQSSKSEGGDEMIAKTPFPFGPVLVSEHPDIQQVRLYQTFRKVPTLQPEGRDDTFYEEKLFFVDSTFFQVFSFELLKGDPKQVLKAPQSIVLTEAAAQKFFGQVDVVGKTLIFEGKLPLQVTGIAKDPPKNAHFTFNAVASLLNIGDIFDATGNTFPYDEWFWTAVHTYIKLPNSANAITIEDQFEDFKNRHQPESFRHDRGYNLQPITNIHIGSNYSGEIEPNRGFQEPYIFLSIGLFILLLAIINFVNLSTSNAIERSKEISLRKVLGAPKIYLIVQLLIESILITYLAIFLAILITGTVLPYFNQLMHTHLDIYLLLGVPLIGLYLLGGLVVGALAGIYPAFYIASFDSVIATRSGMLSQYSNKNNFFRKSLVVFQFAISTVLIFVTLVMFYQHKYLINKDLGFDSSELVMIPIRGTQVKKQIDVFKAEISKNPRILSASTISDVIGERTVYRGFEIEAQAEEKMLPFFYTDYDFAETFGIKMAAGRSFDENIRSDSMAYLINKQALVYFDFDSENALGKRMEDGNIIGVVEDFHATNLHEAITPLVIGIDPEWAAFLAVKVAPGNSQEVIQFLSNTWREFEQGKPFSPFFLNERLQTIYRNEAYTGKLVLGFTILGILVACFGLLGLINYATQARLKEIGIRKVMGGSVRSIYLLFAKNYLLLMVIAFGVALPVAFLLMQNWLREFPYRIALNLFYCAFPIGIVLLMVLSTISYHVIKAANTNPVKVLKDE